MREMFELSPRYGTGKKGFAVVDEDACRAWLDESEVVSIITARPPQRAFAQLKLRYNDKKLDALPEAFAALLIPAPPQEAEQKEAAAAAEQVAQQGADSPPPADVVVTPETPVAVHHEPAPLEDAAKSKENADHGAH